MAKTTLIIIGITYVISAIVSYATIRKWHLQKGVDPSVADVATVFVPIISTVSIFVYGLDLIESGKIAGKFFRIKEIK